MPAGGGATQTRDAVRLIPTSQAVFPSLMHDRMTALLQEGCLCGASCTMRLGPARLRRVYINASIL